MVSENENKKLERLMVRIEKLERWSHPPINCERKIRSLENAYIRLYNTIKKFLKGE